MDSRWYRLRDVAGGLCEPCHSDPYGEFEPLRVARSLLGLVLVLPAPTAPTRRGAAAPSQKKTSISLSVDDEVLAQQLSCRTEPMRALCGWSGSLPDGVCLVASVAEGLL